MADGFDIALTGYSLPEIDGLIEGLLPQEPGAPEDDVLPASAPTRCKPGQLYQLGPHRLTCGNALDRQVVKALMGGELAQMVFADPPWNLAAKSVGGKGKIKHRDFAMAHGEMSRAQFTDFLRTAFTRLVEVSADGAIHFLCIDWRHLREMLDAGEAAYSELKNVIVWAKDNGGMGSFYRSRYELIFAFRHGSAPHINNFKLGEHGRYRTNVWSYKGSITSFAAVRKQLFAMSRAGGHPGALAERCLIAIERLRDEYDRVDDEPRHPDIESGQPWPKEVSDSQPGA